MDHSQLESRFAAVFEHFSYIAEYARRRGSVDPEGLAAETMAIAWRRLADVPVDDPRPWIIGVARNLLLVERRHRDRTIVEGPERIEALTGATDVPVVVGLDPEMEGALLRLAPSEREALLLVAWEELSPAAAAHILGIPAVAFRVRLHRARKRLIAELGKSPSRPSPTGTQAELEIL